MKFLKKLINKLFPKYKKCGYFYRYNGVGYCGIKYSWQCDYVEEKGRIFKCRSCK